MIFNMKNKMIFMNFKKIIKIAYILIPLFFNSLKVRLYGLKYYAFFLIFVSA